MTGDKVCFNGELTQWRDIDIAAETLLHSAYIYTPVNTSAYKPFNLDRRIEIAKTSYKTLYGRMPQITVEEISEQISSLLYYGMYPEHGNMVDIYLIPTADDDTDTLIMHRQSTPDDGYVLMSLKAKAVIANYEIPFEKHLTAVSYSAARFADDYAVRCGANIALRANRAGKLISGSESPLYAVRNGTVLTTPAASGARETVERELMQRVCAEAKIKLIDEDLLTADIASYEEMMLFTPMGIRSISSIGNVLFHNITASLLERIMPVLTREGIAR